MLHWPQFYHSSQYFPWLFVPNSSLILYSNMIQNPSFSISSFNNDFNCFKMILSWSELWQNLTTYFFVTQLPAICSRTKFFKVHLVKYHCFPLVDFLTVWNNILSILFTQFIHQTWAGHYRLYKISEYMFIIYFREDSTKTLEEGDSPYNFYKQLYGEEHLKTFFSIIY